MLIERIETDSGGIAIVRIAFSAKELTTLVAGMGCARQHSGTQDIIRLHDCLTGLLGVLKMRIKGAKK